MTDVEHYDYLLYIFYGTRTDICYSQSAVEVGVHLLHKISMLDIAF